MTAPEAFLRAVRNIIFLSGSGRKAASLYDIPNSTLARIANGADIDMATGRKLGEITGVCPCCGNEWPTADAGGEPT